MICDSLLYYFFNIYIHIKLFIISKCFKTRSDFDICKITICDNTNLFKISNKKEIYTIISNNWHSIKQYNTNTSMIDIQYFYNNEKYNIIYKYPYKFEYPIQIKQSEIKLLYTNDELNDIVMKYAGPMKDFYDMNSQRITMKDISLFHDLVFNKQIFIVNSDLSEKNIKIDDIIDLKI